MTLDWTIVEVPPFQERRDDLARTGAMVLSEAFERWLTPKSQRDEYYDRPHCTKCISQGLGTCCCVWKMREGTRLAAGRNLEDQHDTKRMTEYPVGYRLAAGFALLKASER